MAEGQVDPKVAAIISRVTRLGQLITNQADIIKKASADAYALDFLREKRDILNANFDKADLLHTELLTMTNEESQKIYSYFEEKVWDGVYGAYIELTDLLDQRVNELYKSRDERTMTASSPLTGSHVINPLHHCSTSVNTNLRLPKLEIPQFDGSYDNWQNFHDMFTASVHNNTSLTPAMKLQHLKGSLQGEAAELISAIRITDDNYAIAWDTLKGRYQKESTLLLHHLQKIKALPKITQVSLKLLTQMRNTLKISIDSIQLLDESFGTGGHYLVVDMIEKFSSEMRLEWEKQRAETTSFPTYEELTKFLDNQITILESLDTQGAKKPNHPSKPKSVMNVTVKKTGKCSYCDQDHLTYQCEAFLKLSVAERQKARKALKLCVNCLAKNHPVIECRSKTNCQKCGKPHHTLLHYDVKPSSNKKPKDPNSTDQQKEDQTKPNNQVEDPAVHHVAALTSEVMLATALVKVLAPNGQSLVVRALIDSGAEASFVSETLLQALRLPKRKTTVTINGLQGVRLSSPRFTTFFEVTDTRLGKCKFKVNAYVLQCITAYRPKVFKPTLHEELQDLDLADPAQTKGMRIDLLLGADVMGQFMQEGFLRLKNSQVIAQNSTFGWILSGPVEPSTSSHHVSVQHVTCDLEEELQRFWEIEESPGKPPLSEEDERTEQTFRETTTRDDQGRFIVRLPFVSEEAKQSLGNSFHIAKAAWKRVETQLDKKPGTRKVYDDFMQEYLNLGHMVEIPINETTMNYSYFPHHGVDRDDSLTTKTRVVFNASCNTKSGTSLNDILCTGPKLQNEVSDVVSNWRNHEFVFSADITKMFRQINIHPDDQPFQCILWNKQGDSTPRAFKLTTVTYGTKPAPYLANKVIKALVEQHADEYPKAVEPLSKCIYVDDVLYGANTKSEAIAIREQIDAMLKKGCLELRKWASNCPDILPDESESSTEFFLEPEGDNNKKVLGLAWSPQRDAFGVKVSPVDLSIVTKRIILSNIARIFDPLGWLSPFVIRGKMLMQLLWLAKEGWDEKDLPQEVIDDWHLLCSELPDLAKVSIPRFIGPGNSAATVRLVGFSDASKRAYSAAVYLYVTYESGESKSNLLQAKSRVAPLKTQSIPRLELCGAVELTKLMRKIQAAWLGKIDEVQCFTDSRIVLDWLAKHASSWHTFVANRVSLVQTELPRVKWRHVPSKLNPADLNSRGMSAKDLSESQLWWHGPNLEELESAEPSAEDQEQLRLEVTKEACHVVTMHHGFIPQLPDYLVRHSSWFKILRTLAFCAKYVDILRKRISRTPRPQGETHELLQTHQFRTQLQAQKAPWTTYVITRDQIKRAQDHIYRLIQKNSFSIELKALRDNLPVSKGSPIFHLNPFLDTHGVIRVGGRLQEANLTFAQRHPVLLAPSRVTNTLIRHFHQEASHGGLQSTLALLRDQIWLIHGRNHVKEIIRKCVTCTRQSGTLETQQMSNLPAVRCTEARPFEHVGVDYAGPFDMKNASGRGHTSHKVWVALFVCFSTRAIHLEAVNSLSTADFLAAFKAFTARRGLCTDMYSDQATTFKGAANELQRAFHALTRDPELHNTLATQNIQWHFIPPDAPHYGGLWEAGVKAFKHHFKRILGQFIPAWDEMRTLLCQIEACLNSRPLTPQKDVAEESPPLTTGHFLIGTSLKAIPEPSLLDKRDSLLTRWQSITKMVQTFWTRWRQEYLHTLQRRNKWVTERDNIQVDDIVTVRKEMTPPCDWGLARVVEVVPGRDNLVREVKIFTGKTVLTRPITELCKLPVHSPEQPLDA